MQCSPWTGHTGRSTASCQCASLILVADIGWLLCSLQAMVESLLKEYPNVLILRVRMPIVADLTYERNFIAKIIRYEKVRIKASGKLAFWRLCCFCQNLEASACRGLQGSQGIVSTPCGYTRMGRDIGQAAAGTSQLNIL